MRKVGAAASSTVNGSGVLFSGTLMPDVVTCSVLAPSVVSRTGESLSTLAVAAPVAMVATPASAYVFSNVKIEGNQRIEPAKRRFETIDAFVQLQCHGRRGLAKIRKGVQGASCRGTRPERGAEV